MLRDRPTGDDSEGTTIAGSGLDSGRTSAQRALVPVLSTRPADAALSYPARLPPNAAFLTQLIATAQDATQTRKHRRADPDRVIAAYAAMVQVPASPSCPSHEYRR
jgi:hypothetical protein